MYLANIMELQGFIVIIYTLVSLVICKQFYPVKIPLGVYNYAGKESDGLPMFRSLLIDGQFAYVGAQSSLYKMLLSSYDDNSHSKTSMPSIKTSKPNFNDR